MKGVSPIYDLDKRKNTIKQLIFYMKQGNLTDADKEQLFKIVQNIRKSEIQKRRFYMIYSLGPNIGEHNSYKKLAHYYECSPSAIRNSVKSVEYSLIYISRREMRILEDIVKACNKRLNNK